MPVKNASTSSERMPPISLTKTSSAQSNFPTKFIKPCFVIRCDNHYVIEAETPEQKGGLKIEFEMKKGHEHKMVADEREKERQAVMQEYDAMDDGDW